MDTLRQYKIDILEIYWTHQEDVKRYMVNNLIGYMKMRHDRYPRNGLATQEDECDIWPRNWLETSRG